jgi:hypothetical protein
MHVKLSFGAEVHQRSKNNQHFGTTVNQSASAGMLYIRGLITL